MLHFVNLFDSIALEYCNANKAIEDFHKFLFYHQIFRSRNCVQYFDKLSLAYLLQDV